MRRHNLCQKELIDLQPGAHRQITSREVLVEALLVSVMEGTLDVWFGAGGQPAGIADMRFDPVGHPVQVYLPPGARDFTVMSVPVSGAGARPTKACIYLLADR